MSTLLIGLIVVVLSGIGVGILLFGHVRVPIGEASITHATLPSASSTVSSATQKLQGDPLRIPLVTRLRSFVLLLLLCVGLASAVASVLGIGIYAISFLLG